MMSDKSSSGLAAHIEDLYKNEFSNFRFSAWVLIAANFIPLLGVLLWDWSTFALIAIYWSENVVIGGMNLLKMLFCSPEASTLEEARNQAAEGSKELRESLENHKTIWAINHAAKLFFMPFFAFHYGMFCFVHGVFVFALFGKDNFDFPSPWIMFQKLREEGLLWAVAGLAISHFLSFVWNYLIQGEYRRTTLPSLMGQPYARIVLLHLTILAGGFVTVVLGSPALVLVILVVGKTLLDLGFHLHEHQQKSDKERDQQ